MILITKKEEKVLNKIKDISKESNNQISLSSLKEETGMYEYDLNLILKNLDKKGVVDYKNSIVNLANFDGEINTVDSKADVVSAELNQKEKDSFELIKNIVDENNMVSRYELEGRLLYGDLKLTDFRMYHIILSLENKGLLKPIYKENGDYYMLVD